MGACSTNCLGRGAMPPAMTPASAELAQPTAEPTPRRVLGLKNGFARSGALRTGTAAATCATPHLGFEARRLVVPFDADHRKNDDHGRFRRARHHWLPRG